jgi:Transglycosylase SLT domain
MEPAMRRIALTVLLPFLMLALLAPLDAARAASLGSLSDAGAPGLLCLAATVNAERIAHTPPRLLDAIALVESGRRDTEGVLMPWPWTINAEGIGHFYDTKAEAVQAARDFQARGISSIDVGCMQINLAYHPDAFLSLEQAFDPQANALYAARFLNQLFAQAGSWPKAAADYHSQTPDVGEDYQRRVMALWPEGGHMVASARPSGAALPDLPAPAPSNRVAVMLPGGDAPMRLLPLQQGASAMPSRGALARSASSGAIPLAGYGRPGRTLASYRAVPIPLVARRSLPGG